MLQFQHMSETEYVPQDIISPLSKELSDTKEYLVSPNLEANLGKFNARISVQDPNELAETITDNQDKSARFEFKAFEAHASTKEDPCVVLENMASYCSILVGVDKQGSVVSVHKNLIVDDNVNVNNDPNYIREALSKAGFLDSVSDTLGEERMFFLTGTDFNVAGVDQRYREWFLDQLEEVLGQPVDYLLLNTAEDQSGGTRVGRLMQRVKNVFQRTDRPTMRSLGDLVVVPESVSTTGKTELVYPYVDNKNYFEYMVPFANKMKEKLRYTGK